MLLLKQDGRTIGTTQEGGWVDLPNGDKVSPAMSGWSSGPYSLETAPLEEPSAVVVYVRTVEDQKVARAEAYRIEADPLFFMSQRGEATTEEWLAKVAEIKTRFPYPAE
jgi:hypothetical protein